MKAAETKGNRAVQRTETLLLSIIILFLLFHAQRLWQRPDSYVLTGNENSKPLHLEYLKHECISKNYNF